MPERKPQHWERLLTEGFGKDGVLPDEALSGLQSDAKTQAPYHRWLLLERLFGDTTHSTKQRLQEPSPHELQRGARMVLARLATQEEPATQSASTEEAQTSTQAPHSSQIATLHETLAEPALGTPNATIDSIGETQAEAHTNHAQTTGAAGLWTRLYPLYAGACAVIALLLVVKQVPDLLPSQPAIPGISSQTPHLPGTGPGLPIPHRPGTAPPFYSGAKGAGGSKDPAWLRLFFGVSPAHVAQPQRRGRTGMVVQPGEWLYFLFEKAPVAGYLTLLQVVQRAPAAPQRDDVRFKQLFPGPGKQALVAASQRKWVLSLGQVALRYRVPGTQRAARMARGLAFVGLLTPRPISRLTLQKLQKVTSRWRGQRVKGEGLSLAQREHIATTLGISPRRVAGFHVVIRSVPPQARQPTPKQVP